MSDLYKNKYRISSTRFKHWDYATPASYFITICTKNHFCCFGDVRDKKMVLSDPGKIADKFWQEISDHFRHVELGPFIVMPNHVHGVLNLKDIGGNVETRLNRVSKDGKSDDHDRVSTTNGISDNQNRVSTDDHNRVCPGGVTVTKNPMLNNSVSRIIRWYKGRCTYEIRKAVFKNFQWQARFYDHIIKDEKDYQRINKYVNNNPAKWH